MTHRDSLGWEQVIRPAEVNWMTAGRGISHSERFEGMRERGGVLHGIQAWVALPAEHEEVEPAFEHYARDGLPLIEGEGWSARVIAGELLGARSAVRTHSPLLYAHLELATGARFTVPADASERARLRCAGRGRHRRSGVRAGADAGARPRRDADRRRPRTQHADAPRRRARRPALHLVELRVVASRALEQAKADWNEGRIPRPVGDTDEWIPAPNDPMPAPHRLT